VKRRVLYRPEAQAELIEAWAWYEAQLPGLGDEFQLRKELKRVEMERDLIKKAAAFFARDT